jgi:uncharacterized protein YecE (DUF72 family)
MGTCGWSDPSLLRCGRFYPSSVKTSCDRLRTYSRFFSCVEVDSSCYALLSPATVAEWVASTPRNSENPSCSFIFHFKLFGFLAARGGQISTLPRSIRETTLRSYAGDRYVDINALSESDIDTLWTRFHDSLRPAQARGQLGSIVAQLHLSFCPSDTNWAHVLWLRARLDSAFDLVVEFRNRAWFEGVWGATLPSRLRKAGIGLVVADELAHETRQRDAHQTGLLPGETREVLLMAPLCVETTYVRVHRRHGKERLLPEEEIASWASRLSQLCDIQRHEISLAPTANLIDVTQGGLVTHQSQAQPSELNAVTKSPDHVDDDTGSTANANFSLINSANVSSRAKMKAVETSSPSTIANLNGEARLSRNISSTEGRPERTVRRPRVCGVVGVAIYLFLCAVRDGLIVCFWHCVCSSRIYSCSVDCVLGYSYWYIDVSHNTNFHR